MLRLACGIHILFLGIDDFRKKHTIVDEEGMGDSSQLTLALATDELLILGPGFPLLYIPLPSYGPHLRTCQTG